ncbi:MAG TPA: hypothetical protein VHW04_08735 [Solirubrobacteraceae bacterium]|nr:hypothetical protein [Solirubrobacteraceae bacterium]
MAVRAPVASPRRNRVTPTGDIEALALRCAWTGNRGILHSGSGEIVRLHAHPHWLTCTLQYKGLRREQWLPHRLTWLFFHDEAVSLAAGHRPCALCRRDGYNAYRAAWAEGLGEPPPSAEALDRQLHAERLVRGTRRRRIHSVAWQELPAGAFVLTGEGAPAIVLDECLVTWTHLGYGQRLPRPVRGSAPTLTPPASLAVLRAGYPVQIDDGARAAADG